MESDEDMVLLKDGKNPLLPCPFCGGDAWMTGLWEGGKAVVCMKCKAQGPPSEYQPQVAFDGWNRRALPPVPRRLVRAIRKAAK